MVGTQIQDGPRSVKVHIVRLEMPLCLQLVGKCS